MFTGNPLGQRNENPNYVAYFYESGIVQRYLDSRNSLLAGLSSPTPSIYDFSSDLTGRTGFHHAPTVEQIVANGYLAIPKSDPVKAIISDKKHTSWLGLDDVIGQIRNRYDLYYKNMYELELGKCAAINTFYAHGAWRGEVEPAIDRVKRPVGR